MWAVVYTYRSPCLFEDPKCAPLLAKLEGAATFQKVANGGRMLLDWLNLFKQANRACEPKLLSPEPFVRDDQRL